MNVLQRILRRLKSRTFRHVYYTRFGAPQWSKRDYRAFAQEGYAGNPYVYAAINALVDAASEAPPLLYRVKGGGKIERAVEESYNVKASLNGYSRKRWTKEQCARQLITKASGLYVKRAGIHPSVARRIAIKQLQREDELEEITSHPVLDLLMRPNGYYQTDYKTFMTAHITSLQISGEVFTEPVGGGMAPTELYVLPADKMRAGRSTAGNPLPSFESTGYGREKFIYSPDPLETEIFFAKFYDPVEPLRGLSPMEAATRSVDLNNEARAYNLNFMKNGGVPAGLVTGEFDEVQAQAIQNDFEEEVGGSSNAGRLLTLSGKNMKYSALGTDISKLLWADTLQMTAREVAIVFNVPPEILGDSTSKTFANYASARLALYQDAALPLADFIYGSWNSGWLKRFGDDLFLDYDSDQILAIQDDVDKAYERLEKATFLTLNEKRGAVGWEDIDGGDVILISMNQIPLTALPEDIELEAEKAVQKLIMNGN